MLQKLLRSIDYPGLLGLRELARQLDVHEALVQSMIGTLVGMGYLKPVQGYCAQCDCCPSTANCGEDGSGSGWTLTEAGKRVVRNNAG